MHLYDLFKTYCGAAPKIIKQAPDKRTGKIYSKLAFQTFALPCFAILYELFYPEGKKVVPLNIGFGVSRTHSFDRRIGLLNPKTC